MCTSGSCYIYASKHPRFGTCWHILFYSGIHLKKEHWTSNSPSQDWQSNSSLAVLARMLTHYMYCTSEIIGWEGVPSLLVRWSSTTVAVSTPAKYGFRLPIVKLPLLFDKSGNKKSTLIYVSSAFVSTASYSQQISLIDRLCINFKRLFNTILQWHFALYKSTM